MECLSTMLLRGLRLCQPIGESMIDVEPKQESKRGSRNGFGGAQLQANLMLQLFSSIERVLPGFALMAARNYIAI